MIKGVEGPVSGYSFMNYFPLCPYSIVMEFFPFLKFFLNCWLWLSQWFDVKDTADKLVRCIAHTDDNNILPLATDLLLLTVLVYCSV